MSHSEQEPLLSAQNDDMPSTPSLRQRAANRLQSKWSHWTIIALVRILLGHFLSTF